jgi:hypothetical protein
LNKIKIIKKKSIPPEDKLMERLKQIENDENKRVSGE